MRDASQNAADLLSNAIWEALTGSQQHLALASGKAVRYQPAVAPFAAVRENTVEAMTDLRNLLAADESVYLMGERPLVTTGLRWEAVVPCLQMLFPQGGAIPELGSSLTIEPLDCQNAVEMCALIDLAYPGYFRQATCRMGRYFGVREGGQLIAMCGERLVLGPYREISGLCTHPGHTGKGIGTALLWRTIQDQRAAGAISWLHVVETNRRAIDLYLHLGFVTLQQVELHRVVRA